MPLAEDMQRTLVVSVEPQLTVQGDRELIAQAAINLIENALRHTQPGASVELKALACDDKIVIRIQDNGPGIPAAEQERVQERFVRLESSRSTPGHGLGLSLVRAIAEAHGGRLVLGDAEPGLVAELRFPQRGPM